MGSGDKKINAMAKTSGEFENEFIQSAKEKTGKTVEQWFPVLKATRLSKQMEIVNWLKSEHHFNHLQATLLAGMHLNNGKPVYASEKDLLENLFTKSGAMKSMYTQLQKAIMNWDKNVQFVVKKTYVSLTKKREFATISIRPDELRIGLDLGDMPFNDLIQKSKLIGPMPRISHMVILKSEKEIDKNLFSLLEKADRRINS